MEGKMYSEEEVKRKCIELSEGRLDDSGVAVNVNGSPISPFGYFIGVHVEHGKQRGFYVPIEHVDACFTRDKCTEWKELLHARIDLSESGLTESSPAKVVVDDESTNSNFKGNKIDDESKE